ncbi:MAG: cadherin-like domain-containing protein [Caldilineaceae bacterium]
MAANDSYPTQQEMPLTVDAAHGLLANDRDPDGDQLTIGSISSRESRQPVCPQPDGLHLHTRTGLVGTETFTHQATDGQSLSNPATVAFAVTAQPPRLPLRSYLRRVQPDSKTNFNFTGALGAFKLTTLHRRIGQLWQQQDFFCIAGSYTVTEAVPNGWVNANISCNPPANTVADLVRNQIVINVAAGANVTCTFVTQRAGKIIAGKYEDRNQDQRREKNEPWLNGWRMELYSGPGALMSGQNTSGEGRTVFANLRPGKLHTVCEVVQPGWFNITPHLLTAALNQPCYSVTVEAGKVVWSRFGNSNTTAPVSAAGADDFFWM